MPRPAKLKPNEYPRYTALDVDQLNEILIALDDIRDVLGVKTIPVFDKLRRLIKRRKI